MVKMSKFKVFYKRGYSAPVVVEAEDSRDAAERAVVEYRRNFGTNGIVSNLNVNDLIQKIIAMD